MRISDHLIPLFASPEIDALLARQMAISAIGSYRPEGHADYVNVARTIAFSMAALALLGNAAGQDVTMVEKMRAYGRANALNRSADQSERTMMQRRRQQQASPQSDPLEPADESQPNPEIDIAAAEIDAVVAEAINAYRTQRGTPKPPAAPECPAEQAFQVSGPASAHSTPAVVPPNPASPLSKSVPVSAECASAPPNPIPVHPAAAFPASPPKSALHYPASSFSAPSFPAPSFPAPSFKDELMRQSAMQRTMGAAATPHPG